jgi:hypothetical protein
MDKAIIAKVQSLGFDVYMRNEDDSWLLFTDGTRIGYLQADRLGGFSFSTVHKPNTTTGTGFQIDRNADGFDKSDLERCFIHAPHWALNREASTVVKYKNIGDYISENSFNREYKLVPRVQP